MGQQLSGSFRIDRVESDLYGSFWQDADMDKSDQEHLEFGKFKIDIDQQEGTFNVQQTHTWRRGQLMIQTDLDPPITGTFIVEISGQLHQGWFFWSGNPCKGKFEVQHPFPLYMEKSWREALRKELAKPYFLQLNDSLNEMENVNPALEDIYTWTKACPIDKVKVVILGQDPSKTKAHGLAFSTKPGNQPSESLKRIYEELMLEGLLPRDTKLNHGYLMSWAEQGVLLLNIWLTAKEGVSGSIIDKGWETFTNAVIKHLSDTKTGLVFILWGQPAKGKASLINEVSTSYPEGKHLILRGTHPSPKAQCRAATDFLSYDILNSGHLVRNRAPQYFLECNVFLKSCNKTEINWASPLKVKVENNTSTDSHEE